MAPEQSKPDADLPPQTYGVPSRGPQIASRREQKSKGCAADDIRADQKKYSNDSIKKVCK
jgi:hypothetical protein